MSRFKKQKSTKMAPVSTASLPDIVFMLLFFFMVVTTMKEVDLMVEIKKPEVTEVTKLQNASLIDYIYVGPSLDPQKHGTEPLIQLDDKIVTNVLQIEAFINEKRMPRPEGERAHVTTSLKIDHEVKMYIVTAIKEELRKVDALKILYSARKAVE
jgi:biopolymer transport protein ExbD